MTAVPLQADPQNNVTPGDKSVLRLVPKTGGIAPAEQADGRDSYAVTAVADIIDRSLHATIARFTLGLSPAALSKAYFDWAIHLAVSPGKRLQLVDKATRKSIRFANYAFRSASSGGKTSCCIEPLPQDRRFDGADWQKWPYQFHVRRPSCCSSNGGTTPPPASAASPSSMRRWWSSSSRQMLDMVSPSNFLLTNPEVLRQTISKGGMNLVSGLRNMIGGLGARGQRQEAGRYREFRRGTRRGGNARQGGLPQSADRTDPVRAGDRQGAAGAGAHRAGLDHEILHPRSVAA